MLLSDLMAVETCPCPSSRPSPRPSSRPSVVIGELVMVLYRRVQSGHIWQSQVLELWDEGENPPCKVTLVWVDGDDATRHISNTTLFWCIYSARSGPALLHFTLWRTGTFSCVPTGTCHRLPVLYLTPPPPPRSLICEWGSTGTYFFPLWALCIYGSYIEVTNHWAHLWNIYLFIHCVLWNCLKLP